MKLPADIFLALRYLKPKRTFVSVITLLSIMGPMLGVAVLIIVTAVMGGFDRDIRTGIMNLQAHIQLYSRDSRLISSPGRYVEKLKEKGIAASPLVEGSALLQVRDSAIPKIVRGIAPDTEGDVSAIRSAIVAGTWELKEKECIIGRRLANQLRLWLGSTILLHSPSRLAQNVKWHEDGTVEVTQPDEMYLPEQVKVVGIFDMGVADFDDNILFLHIDQACDLYGYDWDSATSIQCKVKDPMNMEPSKALVEYMLGDLFAETWQERNAMLFATIGNEKKLMTFLMAFIVLVASFSIAATLITVVVQKTREIGVMKTIGMSNATIARVFLLQGGIIGVIGTALGTGLGLMVIFFRSEIADLLSKILGHDVFPAELYHLNKVPAWLTGGDLAFIVLLSLAICIFASIIPAIFASMKVPADALHEDN